MFAKTIQVDPACPVNWQHPLTNGLLSWWMPVDNPGWWGGYTIRDLTGRRPATCHASDLSNLPTFWQAASTDIKGVRRRCCHFQAGSGFGPRFTAANVDVGNSDLTIIGIFRIHTTGTVNKGILSKYEGVSPANSRCWQLGYRENTSPIVLHGLISSAGTGASTAIVTGATTLFAGTVYFGACVYVRSTRITIYLGRPFSGISPYQDGESTTSIPSSIYNPVLPTYIGDQFDQDGATATTMYGTFFAGMVFRRPLSLGELQAWNSEFMYGFPNTLNPLPSPVFYSIPADLGHPATRRFAMSSGGVYRPTEIGRQGTRVI